VVARDKDIILISIYKRLIYSILKENMEFGQI